MHVAILNSFGPAENLRYESVPDPVPAAGQVRIAVKAAGVHFIETLFRQGIPIGPHPVPDLPIVLGGEVAGVVESLGDGVDPSWLGRRVVSADLATGGYAELAVADVAGLAVFGDHLEYGTAVAMNTTGATTMGLLEVAPITENDVVLATAAAGGIGSLLVQHARRVGATVVGAAGGPAKAARVRELGADLAVDYTEPGWAKRVRDLGVTAVYDGVGGDLGAEVFDLLADGGRHVAFGQASGRPFAPSAEVLRERGITWIDGIGHLLGRPGGVGELRERALTDTGLTLAVQSFPLDRAAQAHAALESRDTMGKVVLLPA